MRDVVLLTRPSCPACDQARVELAALAAEVGFEWVERDATLDDAEFAEYGDRLPVVLLDGREHSFWTVDVRRLRRDLGL